MFCAGLTSHHRQTLHTVFCSRLAPQTMRKKRSQGAQRSNRQSHDVSLWYAITATVAITANRLCCMPCLLPAAPLTCAAYLIFFRYLLFAFACTRSKPLMPPHHHCRAMVCARLQLRIRLLEKAHYRFAIGNALYGFGNQRRNRKLAYACTGFCTL